MRPPATAILLVLLTATALPAFAGTLAPAAVEAEDLLADVPAHRQPLVRALVDAARQDASPAEKGLDAADLLLAGSAAGLDPVPQTLRWAQEDLRTARAVLEAHEAQGLTDVQRAEAYARVLTDHQLRGLPAAAAAVPLERPAHEDVASALRALAQRHGQTLSPEQEESLASFDALPAQVRADLLRVVDAFIALDVATAAAFAGPDGAAQEALAPVLEARMALVSAALALFESTRSPSMAAVACITWPAPPLWWIELGACPPTAYCFGDIQLIIDQSGNDMYCNNAGGNNLSNGLLCPPLPGVTAAVLDLDGNDVYAPAGGMRGCGVNGGGVAGTGIIVDVLGHDRYHANHEGTNGGGADGGAGLILDVAGDDVRIAGDEGTNGGGAFSGRGGILDVAGNDRYQASSGFGMWVGGGTNGGALMRAQGILLDVQGEDTYVAGPQGANGGAHEIARGFLMDVLGNDVYQATGLGVNGGASVESLGVLVDVAGDDRYQGGNGGVNGGSVSTSTSLLLDAVGSDRYVGGSSGVNGGVAGGGQAYLIDVLGDDSYEAQGYGTNGGAYHGGLTSTSQAYLVDLMGFDAYVDDTGYGSTGGAYGAGAQGFHFDFGLLGWLGMGFDVDYYQGPAAAFVGQNGAVENGANGGLLLNWGGWGDTYCDAYNFFGCMVDWTISPKGSGSGTQSDF